MPLTKACQLAIARAGVAQIGECARQNTPAPRLAVPLSEPRTCAQHLQWAPGADKIEIAQKLARRRDGDVALGEERTVSRDPAVEARTRPAYMAVLKGRP